MEGEIVTHADRINPDQGEPGTELVEESNDLPTSALPAPGVHRDVPPSIVIGLADVHDGFRFSASDIHAGDQGSRPGISVSK
jgi:hypothetical protein